MGIDLGVVGTSWVERELILGSANSFGEVEIHLEELELTWGRGN